MPTRHLIGRLTVEIALTGLDQAPARQQEISAWARADGLWRDLSQALDHLVPPEEVLTIPRLEITVAASSETAFQAQLRQALTQAIGQLLQCREATAVRRPLGHYIEQLAWHFLTTGTLPWTTPQEQAPAVAAFLNQLPTIEKEVFARQLRAASAADFSVWQRLVYAIGIEKAQRLVLHYGHFSPAQTALLLQAIFAAEQQGGEAVLHILYYTLINQHLNALAPADFQQALQLAGTGTAPLPKQLDTASPPPADDSTALISANNDEPTAERYFIPHAGLVLLHQFLPELFRQADLLAGTEFRDEDARFKAIHLLHYLATGETEAYEYDLVLNKLLCHHPLARPVPRWVPLTEADLGQADALLAAAIQHWQVLRNTSAAGLRETFLQRSGQLSAAPDGNWHLRVARKTVDILLDRLPMGWGYSVVSLPWLPKLIFVEW